jgi:hypothetical protein
MIEAVTYGMIPSAKSENWDSAPPENRFRNDRIVPLRLLKYSWIVSALTPGAGIHEPSR